MFKPCPDALPRMDADGDADDISAVKGAVEGGTLRRRQQQKMEKQRQKEKQETERQAQRAVPEDLDDTDDGQEAPLADTEVCITPPTNGEVVNL